MLPETDHSTSLNRVSVTFVSFQMRCKSVSTSARRIDPFHSPDKLRYSTSFLDTSSDVPGIIFCDFFLDNLSISRLTLHRDFGLADICSRAHPIGGGVSGIHRA